MYVILGANGKIGRATIDRLRGHGAPARAVVRDAMRTEDIAASGCDIAVADFHDASPLRKAIEGATAVQVICPTSFHEKGRLFGRRRRLASAMALEPLLPRGDVLKSPFH
jgi:uncharacterized protein YbjT (DUF2867 family)